MMEKKTDKWIYMHRYPLRFRKIQFETYYETVWTISIFLCYYYFFMLLNAIFDFECKPGSLRWFIIRRNMNKYPSMIIS